MILVSEIVNDPQQMRRDIYYAFQNAHKILNELERCHRSKRKMRSEIDGFF